MSYAKPLLIRDAGGPLLLDRVAVSRDDSEHTEAFLQDLVFSHPASLPIAEIDRAYEDLVPICKELYTAAGYIDALYVTRTGRLVLMEAKLWRNPEARRMVVAQILDYAQALSTWSYEDLQREACKTLGRKGNVLYELVSAAYPGTDEAQFVDQVQLSLRRGRFLLLIIGDGIREGAGAIANFLETVGSLEFTFGLVEVTLYRQPDIGLLVLPRVVARTVEFRRVVVELPEHASIAQQAPESSAEEVLTDRQKFYTSFWTEFLDDLKLDDPSQPFARPTKTENIYFAMPPSSSTAWVSAYFSRTKGRVGVYLRFTKGAFAEAAFERLLAERVQIDEELGADVLWQPEDNCVALRKPVSDPLAPQARLEIKQFFADSINRFVNVFRPRLERIVSETQSPSA
jgi:hypothetical protein